MLAVQLLSQNLVTHQEDRQAGVIPKVAEHPKTIAAQPVSFIHDQQKRALANSLHDPLIEV